MQEWDPVCDARVGPCMECIAMLEQSTAIAAEQVQPKPFFELLSRLDAPWYTSTCSPPTRKQPPWLLVCQGGDFAQASLRLPKCICNASGHKAIIGKTTRHILLSCSISDDLQSCIEQSPDGSSLLFRHRRPWGNVKDGCPPATDASLT